MALALEALQQSLLFHAMKKDTVLLEEVLLGQTLLDACVHRTGNLFLTPRAQIPKLVMTTILETATKNQ